MTTWDKLLEGNQAKAPNTLLVAFVARHFPVPHPDADLIHRFLDIGPGRHAANQVFLETRGYDVFSVDPSSRALKNMQADICEVSFPAESFDLIYDINTLCHVKNPPIERIRDWLKPGGWFFSIAPAFITWHEVGKGKDFTRFATRDEIKELYGCFPNLIAGRLSYPHNGHQIVSHVVEAQK